MKSLAENVLFKKDKSPINIYPFKPHWSLACAIREFCFDMNFKVKERNEITRADYNQFKESYTLAVKAFEINIVPDRHINSIVELSDLLIEAHSLRDAGQICNDEFLSIFLNVRKKLLQKMNTIKNLYSKYLNKNIEKNSVNCLRAKLSLLECEN